jgi:hypothetical protein
MPTMSLPYKWHAESGPIWVYDGLGGPMVARNGHEEEVAPGQWLSVLAMVRC